MQYVIQKDDTSITKLAKKFNVEAKRWPEFCAANPNLKKDPVAGCLYYVGKTVNIPDSWVPAGTPGSSPLPAPPGVPVPQPVGPPVDPLAPPASPSLFGSLDAKKVMMGAAAVAAVVVGVYAFKRKGRASAQA